MTTVDAVKRDAPEARPARPQKVLGMARRDALLSVHLPFSSLSIFDDRHTQFSRFKNPCIYSQKYSGALPITPTFWVILDQHPDQPRHLAGWWDFWFPAGVCSHPGWFAESSCVPALMTFCGVASNFAGVPLAFAFIALLSPDRDADRLDEGIRI